jgi:hypothetical protein
VVRARSPVSPRQPNRVPPRDRITSPDNGLSEVGVRRYQAATMIDGHGPIGCDRTGKAYDTAPDRPNV